MVSTSGTCALIPYISMRVIASKGKVVLTKRVLGAGEDGFSMVDEKRSYRQPVNIKESAAIDGLCTTCIHPLTSPLPK